MKRVFLGLWLIVVFFKELCFSVYAVLLVVVGPTKRFQPAIVKYPLRLKNDLSITMLSNLITLTPGTITLDVSKDKKFLYIHALDFRGQTHESFEKGIYNSFERLVGKVFE